MLHKVFALTSFFLIGGTTAPSSTSVPRTALTPAIVQASTTPKANVRWYTWEEAVEASKAEPRKIFVDIYTDWCGWCKVMDEKTFQHPTIAKMLNEDYYAVKLDAEMREDIVFKDYRFKYIPNGRRGYHQLAYELLNGRLSYPSIVVLDESFDRILVAPGYQKPEDFKYVLSFAAGNHYQSMSWKAYRNSIN